MLLLIPALAQAAAMLVDEGKFHRRRGLPRWERLGHPLDTATTALCYAWLVGARAGSTAALSSYVLLCVFSCLFITKDEFLHARVCSPGEMWVHALLFVLHPIVLAAFGVAWWFGIQPAIIRIQLLLTIAFGAYQALYWGLHANAREQQRASRKQRHLRDARRALVRGRR